MYAITGITGQVGGTLARTLLAAGREVRAVVRDAARGEPWVRQGCEPALAELTDVPALIRAFSGAEGVFILLPPAFDPKPGFPAARRIIAAVREALEMAGPKKVVALSTIGADADRPNLLNQLRIMEEQFSTLGLPVTFLRAAWFMENARWDIDAARAGAITSYLQPASRAIAMVSTADVGRTAAELLQEDWKGRRVVQLEGPQRTSPDDIAAAFARLLGREVRVDTVPRAEWEGIFRAQGMENPLPRMQMVDGFNAGWIDFAHGGRESRKGRVGIEAALRAMLDDQAAA
ncbi:NAD(P)H-binding protein [Herbaspirillum sp. LeCh32-8]|uniref:NAD(P)H-binding protein n=1 Tax=Herbaspirillum sp. LeCh32-8 TaxID=2821356 RepID=UPI001AE3F458|nr:NAD(P)H-binding protein [Herbaspirillum sp. LeCh32-8]MBP0599043.1 NAD(P)H-binding protein [Herbaspirillum sp. LeCh32-8]